MTLNTDPLVARVDPAEAELASEDPCILFTKDHLAKVLATLRWKALRPESKVSPVYPGAQDHALAESIFAESERIAQADNMAVLKEVIRRGPRAWSRPDSDPVGDVMRWKRAEVAKGYQSACGDTRGRENFLAREIREL